MKSISDFFIYDLKSKAKGEEASLHIFNLGFEERCLAYPKFISSKKKINDKYFCLTTSNDRLSDFLIDSKEENKNALASLFPSIDFDDIIEILPKLTNALSRFTNIFIDISTLPRGYIFKLFTLLFETNSLEGKRFFLIYTFPKAYVYEKLQQKAPTIDSFYDNIKFKFSDNPLVIMIPGFDIEDTNISMAFLAGRANERRIEYKWLIPFPGRFYSFYERVLESNLSHLDWSKITLFPQDEINMAIKMLKDELVHDDKGRTIIFVPIGCRLNCVSVIFASFILKKEGFKNVDIIIPSTKEYTSLRSSGYIEPIIEEVYLPNHVK